MLKDYSTENKPFKTYFPKRKDLLDGIDLYKENQFIRRGVNAWKMPSNPKSTKKW